MTQTIPIGKAASRLDELAAVVTEQNEEVEITRPGLPSVTLISAARLISLRETLAILSDPEAVRDMQGAKKDVAAGRLYGAAEVLAEMKARRGVASLWDGRSPPEEELVTAAQNLQNLTYGPPYTPEEEAAVLAQLPPPGSPVVVSYSVQLPFEVGVTLQKLADARGVAATDLIQEWAEEGVRAATGD